jgi:hypothetical protein
MSPFAGYLLGILVFIVGLAVAAFLLNVPTGAIVVAVILALFAIAAWATRRPRARPSKFTGATPSAPSLDRTVLMELKTTLMEQADKARTQPTTRMPQSNDSRVEPTTRIDQQTAAARRPPSPSQKTTPRDD